jgi:hypothetical protein
MATRGPNQRFISTLEMAGGSAPQAVSSVDLVCGSAP